MSHIVVVDNFDSFVYNLVDACAVSEHELTVVRNTTPVEDILALQPDLIILSPGPGHPREAGTMMDVIKRALGHIPILGICLGFQALIEHLGGTVEPCGPVHGRMDFMELTSEGAHSELFEGLIVAPHPDHTYEAGDHVPIARYHSLGCITPPAGLRVLGTCPSEKGDVVMAGLIESGTAPALGFQFHPESILSPAGPHMLTRAISLLTAEKTH